MKKQNVAYSVYWVACVHAAKINFFDIAGKCWLHESKFA